MKKLGLASFFILSMLLLYPQLALSALSQSNGVKLTPGITHWIGQVDVSKLPVSTVRSKNQPVTIRSAVYADPQGLAKEKNQAVQPGFVPPGEQAKVIKGSSPTPMTSPSQFTVSSNLILDGAPNDGGNTCGCTPPDPDVAVGPNHVFEIVNVAGIVYFKTGVLAKATFSLSTFFNLPVTSMSDPQILYDAGSGRWFASIVDIPDGRVQIAVSTTNDPTGAFNLYFVSTAGPSILPDHPWLGESDDKIVILAYDFNPSFIGTQYWVLNKAELVAGAATIDFSTGTADTLYASVHPVRHLGSTSGLAYMVEMAFGSTSTARLFTISGVPPGPITVTTNNFAINPISNPPNGVQPDPSPVDTNDDHIVSAVWEANTLWFAAIDACIPNGDTVTRSCLRLIQLTTAGTSPPTKVQDFDYASAGQYLFYPALSLSSGSLAVVYGLSSSTVFPSLLLTGRLPTDPPNTLQPPYTIKIGTAPNNNNRYGDYFGAATDPTPSLTSAFWVAGEYRKPTTLQGWSTAIAQVPPLTAKVGNYTWAELGPKPISSQASGTPYGTAPMSARITAIAINNSNIQNIYVGSAHGGVWKTTDGGITWYSLTDQQSSLATGVITLSSDQKTLFVGTGEPNHSGETYYGEGLLRSTDAGKTWTTLGLRFFGNSSISGVLVQSTNQNHILVSTTWGACCGRSLHSAINPNGAGIYSSLDGGQSWTLVLQPPGSFSTGFAQLLADPLNNNIVYAGDFSGTVWRSTDFGSTWTRFAGYTSPSLQGRVALAISPAKPNTLYAAFANSAGELNGIFRYNVTSRQNVTLATPPGPPAFPSQTACGGQCYYDLVVAVNPITASVIDFGARDLYVSTDSGSSWVDVGGLWATQSIIHPDQHALSFLPGTGTVFVGNDGGIWKSADQGSTWTNLNGNLGTSELYSLAVSPSLTGPSIIAGTQDQGLVAYSTLWSQQVTGDVGFTGFERTTPSIAYMYDDNYFYKSTDGGTTWNSAITGLTQNYFLAPVAQDPNTPGTLYVAAQDVFRSVDYGSTWTDISGPVNTFQATALVVAPSNSNVLYMTDTTGAVRVSNNGGASWTTHQSPDSLAISSIDVDPANSSRIYISYASLNPLVLAGSNNGGSWTFLPTAGLPKAAIVEIKVIGSILLVGSDAGVDYSTNNGVSWSQLGNGLPHVPTYGIVAVSNSVYVATLGRGVWKTFLWGPTSTTVMCPSSGTIGVALTCTATVSDTAGGATPTGTVTLTPGGICTLISGSCSVSITPTAAGPLSITASYGGDSTHTASSGTATITVKRPTTITTSLFTSLGISIPIGGSVPLGTSIFDNATVGSAVAGPAITGNVNYTIYKSGDCAGTSRMFSPLPLGSHSPATGPRPAETDSFKATYLGDSNYSSVTSSCEPFTVLKGETTTATVLYTSSGASFPMGTSVPAATIVYDNATVVGSVPSSPMSGVVTFIFFANSNCVGTGSSAGGGQPIGGAAVVSSNEGPLSAGSYSFQAAFGGDADYLPSTGPCEPFNVFDFGMTDLSDVTVNHVGVTNITISITASGAQAQSVTLSCGGPPVGVSCFSFYPSSGVPPFTSILTVTFTNSTESMDTSVTVTVIGTESGLIHTTQFILHIPNGSVGGEIIPVDKLRLIAPYAMALLGTSIISLLSLIVLVRRSKQSNEKRAKEAL